MFYAQRRRRCRWVTSCATSRRWWSVLGCMIFLKTAFPADCTVSSTLSRWNSSPTTSSSGHTSSSAVADRPRDASCLSVVSFNSGLRIDEYAQLNSILLSSTYPSTDKNDVQVWRHKQHSLMLALRRPSAWYTNAAAECDNLAVVAATAATRRSSSHRKSRFLSIFCPN